MSSNYPPDDTQPPKIRINSTLHNPFDDNNTSTSTTTNDPYRPISTGIGRALTSDSNLPVLPSPSASTDYLNPPRPHPLRDGYTSPELSVISSRRTSVSSDDGSRGALLSPSGDFTHPPSRTDSDENQVNTQTVSTKYNIMPSDGLLIFPEDVEKDDYLHNPGPNDKERDCDICNRRGMINIVGLVVLTLGFLMLFVGYPVL